MPSTAMRADDEPGAQTRKTPRPVYLPLVGKLNVTFFPGLHVTEVTVDDGTPFVASPLMVRFVGATEVPLLEAVPLDWPLLDPPLLEPPLLDVPLDPPPVEPPELQAVTTPHATASTAQDVRWFHIAVCLPRS